MMEKDKRQNFWAEVRSYITTIAVVFVVVLFVNNFLLINARIPSSSMENTIMMNDRIFGNRLAYRNEDPERFDIVIFHYPDDPSKLFIKRVIGLPGETIEIRSGKVYVDGAQDPLADTFCPEAPTGDFGPFTVPEGCYFMLGDNRNNSHDSRYWENPYVEKDEILGKAVLRYWPLTKIGVVE